MGLLSEVAGKNDQAVLTFARIPKEFPSSKLVPLAYLGMGIVLDAKGNKDLAKKAYMACVDVPPWENPVWEEARKGAGLPAGYETPAMIAKREAEEKAAAEAKVASAFGQVSYEINAIAQLRFQVRVAKTIAPTKPNLKAVPVVEAEAKRKVKDDYCPAKQVFIDEYGPDEFTKRAKTYCSETPPVGTAGGSQNLTAECQTIVATACAATPAKDSAFNKKKAAAKVEKDIADEGERKLKAYAETVGYSKEVRIARPDGSNVSIPHKYGCTCSGGGSVDYPKGKKCQEMTGMDGRYCVFTCE